MIFQTSKKEDTMNQPNAERVYQVLVRIIERRYNVKIEYILATPGSTNQ